MITKDEILRKEVRALNIKQPFAELTARHGKQETRTWPTQYRGLVLICASVNPYADREIIDIAGAEQYARILQVLGPKWFNQVKRGSALAIARLVDVVPMEKTPSPAHAETITFVKYNPALFIHVYEDMTLIKPFPWRGALGLTQITATQKIGIQILPHAL